jgi:hypothetical protein
MHEDAIEELAGLEAIYDEDCVRSDLSLTVQVSASLTLVINLPLPSNYPVSGLSVDRPEVNVIGLASTKASEALMVGELNEVYARAEAGTCVLMDYVMHLQEREDEERGGGDNNEEEEEEGGEEGKKKKEVEDSVCSWVSGEPVVDRKSVFVAHIAHVTSIQQAQQGMRELIGGSKKIQRATHNITAYRIASTLNNGSSSFVHDNDDDGERAAGGRLAHLLEMTDARDVCVVVSRWYGGIHLGPDRFKRINESARQLLQAHGYERMRN